MRGENAQAFDGIPAFCSDLLPGPTFSVHYFCEKLFSLKGSMLSYIFHVFLYFNVHMTYSMT